MGTNYFYWVCISQLIIFSLSIFSEMCRVHKNINNRLLGGQTVPLQRNIDCVHAPVVYTLFTIKVHVSTKLNIHN